MTTQALHIALGMTAKFQLMRETAATEATWYSAAWYLLECTSIPFMSIKINTSQNHSDKKRTNEDFF